MWGSWFSPSTAWAEVRHFVANKHLYPQSHLAGSWHLPAPICLGKRILAGLDGAGLLHSYT